MIVCVFKVMIYLAIVKRVRLIKSSSSSINVSIIGVFERKSGEF